MRILLWHVHGSWTTAFLQGGHEYFIPVLPRRGEDGLGRARTWKWPRSAVEVSPAEAADLRLDVVIAQRPVELRHLIESWTGRRPGVDVATIYLEHNTPPRVGARHIAAEDCVGVVHVTHFNACMWDCGHAPIDVVEHGVVDPGPLYSGALERAVAVINEPVRRGFSAGGDIVGRLARELPLDLFGMQTDTVGGRGELDQIDLHREMARRRVYVHPYRWTSLGLSLVEAMTLGMPVVAVAATAATDAVPAEAGVVTCDMAHLRRAVCHFVSDEEAAREAGRAAREYALRRYGLERFLADWDAVLERATA